MGIIATNDREIKFYYSSATSIGKQALAYVKASNKKILEIDIVKTKVTGTQWAELADLLHIPIQKLVNTEHPDFMMEYGKIHAIYSDADWLKVLENNPKVVTQPILVNGDRAIQIDSPSNVLSLLQNEP